MTSQRTKLTQPRLNFFLNKRTVLIYFLDKKVTQQPASKFENTRKH